MNKDIILASKSETRIKLLTNAGIKFKSVTHSVDENEIKLSMSSSTPEEVVVKLAEMKALKTSASNLDHFVIGSDQGLDLNGELINKAKDKDEAKAQLIKMSGTIHTLITVTTVAQNNRIIWKHVDRSKMKMRELKENQITEYLDGVDDKVLNLVGVYAIEEEGLKLFEYLQGDLFSIQGISMIQLCQFLWDNNMLFEKHVIYKNSSYWPPGGPQFVTHHTQLLD